jgi:anti-sigma factor RsiW
MRVCEWFDQYRDEDLNAAQREQFEAHLTGCPVCRARMALLDNVVCALRQSSADAPLGFSERIARRAFNQRKSWDLMVVSWLRPAPALIALIVTLFIFSSLWLIPGFRQTETVGEYEAVVNESYGVSPISSSGQIHSDDDLLNLLEQEGGAR